jgi:hypothetical protein
VALLGAGFRVVCLLDQGCGWCCSFVSAVRGVVGFSFLSFFASFCSFSDLLLSVWL